MDSKQFFDLVSKMRDAQKNYFRSRASSFLTESKRLEKQVDSEIERVKAVIAKRNNPSLF